MSDLKTRSPSTNSPKSAPVKFSTPVNNSYNDEVKPVLAFDSPSSDDGFVSNSNSRPIDVFEKFTPANFVKEAGAGIGFEGDPWATARWDDVKAEEDAPKTRSKSVEYNIPTSGF